MKKILFLLIILYSYSNLNAQLNNNPFDKLSQSLFENEMLSNRFLRNFTLIKTNSYKKRALRDMDQSLAKFDDNLSYIILHLPDNHNVKEDFMKLQNLWNVYRIQVTDYDKNNYKSLIRKTLKLDQLTNSLKIKILDLQNANSINSNTIKTINYMIENAKKTDQLLTMYVLQGGLKFTDASSYYDVDFSDLYKKIKKISKYKYKTTDTNEILIDLNNSIKMMESLIAKKGYNPKMLFSDVNNYSKKSFLLFKKFMNTIKN